MGWKPKKNRPIKQISWNRLDKDKPWEWQWRNIYKEKEICIICVANHKGMSGVQ
jgi:hypothetical protein